MTLKHFSLFTGIGGIDMAAEWAGIETVGQCELADYPYKVLQKHWPNVPKWNLTIPGEAWLDAEAAELLHSGKWSLYFEGGVNLRNDNGLSEGIHRLTCLGNAVMPHQVYPIFKAIMEIERRNEK